MHYYQNSSLGNDLPKGKSPSGDDLPERKALNPNSSDTQKNQSVDMLVESSVKTHLPLDNKHEVVSVHRVLV